MAGPTERLQSNLDAAGKAVTVENAANPRDAVPLAQVQTLDATVLATSEAFTLSALAAQSFGTASSTTLQAIDASALSEGSIRIVATYMAPWKLVDGTVNARTTIPHQVLPAAGRTNWWWIRIVCDGDPFWQGQQTWYIDPAGTNSTPGDDEASGLSSSHPIKTLAEWRRRIRGAVYTGTGPVIHPLSSGFNADDGFFDGFSTPDLLTYVRIVGVPIPTGQTGTVGSYQPYSGNNRAQFTDSAIPVSWSASNGISNGTGSKWIRKTGTGVRHYAHALKDLGSKTVHLGIVVDWDETDTITTRTTETNFANGDTYEVVSLPTWPAPVVNSGNVLYQNLDVLGLVNPNDRQIEQSLAQLRFRLCGFPTNIPFDGQAIFYSCVICSTSPSGMNLARAPIFSNCSVCNGSILQCNETGISWNGSTNVIVGSELRIWHGANMGSLGGLRTFDNAGPCINVRHDSTCRLSASVVGSGNTGKLINCDTAGIVYGAEQVTATTSDPLPYQVNLIAYSTPVVDDGSGDGIYFGAGTGGALTRHVNTGDAVNAQDVIPLHQAQSLIASATTTLEADGIATGAVQLASLAFPATGAVICKVAKVRDFFYLDRTSTATADGITIVTALGLTGRWIRMGIADPSWLATTAWFIDPAGGNDENTGATGSRLKTRSELARRIRGYRLTAPITVTVAGSLNAGDTLEPQVLTDLTNFISWVGVPVLLFSGTISAITNRNGSTSQPTLMTINSIATSWTLGNGTTSFLNMLVEWTDGSGHFITSRVCRDMGSKQAWLSPPISELNLETTFTNGTTVNIYDVPSLGTTVTHNTAKQQFTYLKVDQRWLMTGGQLFMFKCAGDSLFMAGSIDLTNGVSGLFSGASLANLGARLNITGGYHRVVNTGGTCSLKQSATFYSIQVEDSQFYDFAGGAFGNPDIEICTTSTTLTPLLFPLGTAWFNLRGFIYGSTARTGSLFIEAQGRQVTVSIGHVPNITGANVIFYTLAGTTDNVSVLATRESNDVNGNRVIGPAGPTWNDNRSQPIANLGSGGATSTNAANIGDAQAIGAAAAVPATAGAVATTGHTAESVLVSIAGTVSDLPLTASTLVGRLASGDVVAVPFASVVSGGGGGGAITALTGDVTATGPGSVATTIANGAVTNVKRANMAASTLSGNATGSPAAPTDLTAAAVKTLLAIVFADVTGTLQAAQFPALTGDVTTPGGSLATTLANLPQTVLLARTAALTSPPAFNAQRLTGVADPSNPQDAATKHYVDASFSGGVPLVDGDKGDVVVSSSGAVWTVDTDVVTFAKMQNIPTQTLIGRQTALTGDPESIGVTGNIEFDGIGNIRRGALTGDVVASAGSAGTVISNNAVTNAQLADVPTGTVKGRTTAGPGDPTDLTFAALKTALAISLTLDVIGTLQAGQFPALTGDVTTPGGSLVTTLAATGVVAGTYGDASHSLTAQVDAKGRVLSISAPSISITAGAVSGLSTTQTGALTGDVTKPAGSGTTTLVNIPNDTTVPGDILGVTSAAPATPAAGRGRLWFDNVDSIWKNKDESGNVTHMTRAQAAVAHKFITAINADGSVGNGQPDISDLAAIPSLTTVANVTGGSASPAAATVAQMRTMLGLDVAQTFEFELSWGLGIPIGGGSNENSPPRTIVGNWPFWLMPTTWASLITNNPYTAGNHDANLSSPELAFEFVVDRSFSTCDLLYNCTIFDPQNGSGSPGIDLVVSKNTLVDASPCAITISATGKSATNPQSYSFVRGDTIGVRMQGNSDWGTLGPPPFAHVKFTVKVRLMP